MCHTPLYTHGVSPCAAPLVVMKALLLSTLPLAVLAVLSCATHSRCHALAAATQATGTCANSNPSGSAASVSSGTTSSSHDASRWCRSGSSSASRPATSSECSAECASGSGSAVLIAGGTVVNADGEMQADVYIEGDTIRLVQPDLQVG